MCKDSYLEKYGKKRPWLVLKCYAGDRFVVLRETKTNERVAGGPVKIYRG
jgi:hypothetical protein